MRYVGEPVAVVVASDRYRAEDALELIEVRYRPLPAVVESPSVESRGPPFESLPLPINSMCTPTHVVDLDVVEITVQLLFYQCLS